MNSTPPNRVRTQISRNKQCWWELDETKATRLRSGARWRPQIRPRNHVYFYFIFYKLDEQYWECFCWPSISEIDTYFPWNVAHLLQLSFILDLAWKTKGQNHSKPKFPGIIHLYLWGAFLLCLDLMSRCQLSLCLNILNINTDMRM